MSVVDELGDLVDWRNGLIPPVIFSDPEVHERELELLFPRCWLFLAHETMLKRSGDFFTTYMGADPVLVVRQKDSSVKAYYNACRHRGMRVCRAEAGNSRGFTCTYHGWSYDIAGKLVGVPQFDDGYYGELDMEQWGLVEVPQIDSYKGLIFGCSDQTTPPLIEYLGDFTWILDGLVDARAGGVEVCGSVHKWRFKGNWKLAAEQWAGDAYHAQASHVSQIMAVMDAPLEPPEMPEGMPSIGRQFASRLGHGGAFFNFPMNRYNPFVGGPSVAAYFNEHAAETQERLLPATTMHANLFPNMSFGATIPRIVVWHPKGPNEIEAWSWIFVDVGAPEEVKRELLRNVQWSFSPSGLAEKDDGENWSEIQRNAVEGSLIKRIPLNYQMGLGHEHNDDPVFPGTINGEINGDLPQRGFYRRWLEFLAGGDSWPAVDLSQSVTEV